MDVLLRRRRNPSSSNLSLERPSRGAAAAGGGGGPGSSNAPGATPRSHGLLTPNSAALTTGRTGDSTAAGMHGEPASRTTRRPSQAVSSVLLQAPTTPFGPDAIQRSARLSSQLRDRLEAIKRVAAAIRKSELSDVTHRLLDSWSTSVQQLVLECDELIAYLPTRVAEMDLTVRRGSGQTTVTGYTAVVPPLSSGGSQRSPSTTTFEVPTPTLAGGAARSPQQPSILIAAAGGGGLPAAPSHPPTLVVQRPSMSGTSAAPRMTTTASSSSGAVVPVSTIDHMIPDTGATAQILEVTPEGAAEKTRALALCLHATLDGACRSVNAQKASIFMPQRGVSTDLRSVCSVGFGSGENHTLYRPPSTSPEVLCMKTGILLVCANGVNPPVELDMRAALAFFQHQASHEAGDADADLADADGSVDLDALVESRARELQHIPQEARDMFNFVAPHLSDTGSLLPRAPPGGKQPGSRGKRSNSEGAGGLASSIVTSLKSRYWSKVVCPIRLNNSTPTLGVLTVLNKDEGNSNFSEEDESILFGAATVLAGMVARCTDIELLCRSYVPRLPLPSFPQHLSSRVTIPGSRNQLVYRTKDPSGGRELKILLESGKAERLDGHTALVSVADYIHRMQQSWRDAVLLNAELRRTHEDRTRMVTNLLVRARTSELKNTVMEQERVSMVPNDDEHNAQYFRDYAKFLKLKPLLQTLGDRDDDVEERLLSDRATATLDSADGFVPQPKRGPTNGGKKVRVHRNVVAAKDSTDARKGIVADDALQQDNPSEPDEESLPVDKGSTDGEEDDNDCVKDSGEDEEQEEDAAEGDEDDDDGSTTPASDANVGSIDCPSEDGRAPSSMFDGGGGGLPEMRSSDVDPMEVASGNGGKRSPALSPPSQALRTRGTPRSSQSPAAPNTPAASGALSLSQQRELARVKQQNSRDAQELLFGNRLPPPVE